MSDRLRAMGSLLDAPEDTDLAPVVVSHLRSHPTKGVSRSWQRPVFVPWGRRLATAALASILIMGVTLALSPTARVAVARWLGVAGIKIELKEPPPGIETGELRLGRKVSIAEATRLSAFSIRLPDRTLLGDPDEILFEDAISSGQVSLVYLTDSSEVSILITQFEGQVREEFFLKQAGSGTRVIAAQVNGAEAYWLEGRPHSFAYQVRDGSTFEERVRLAGNVLLWERDGIVFRIESRIGSGLGKDATVRIAEGMRAR